MKRGVTVTTGRSMALATRLERLFLVVFGSMTLLMPFLYLQFNFFLVAALVLILCVAAIHAYRETRTYLWIRRLVGTHPILVLFTVALVTRLLCVLIVASHTRQVSDFLGVYDDSLQRVPTSHSPIWTHYITYPYILHFLVDLFGRSTLVGGAFNAVVNSVSIVLTYMVGAAIFNKKTGFVAATLLLLWPGVALYTVIYAPDHLSICFALLSILCFIRLITLRTRRVKICYTVACAASLWFLGFFKDVTPILVIAFVITTVILLLRSGYVKQNLLTVYCVLGLCVFSVFGGMTRMPIISAIAGRSVNPSLVSYFIYTGLGGNNTGSWEPQIMSHYTELITHDKYNYALANHTMMHEALSSVKHRLPEIPATLWNKSRNVQSNDDAKISWVEASAEADNSIGLLGTLQSIAEPLNGVFFAGLIMLMSVGVYYAWAEKHIHPKVIVLFVVCIGYSLLLLVIEAQNRYRYLIEPLYCMLAAYGLLNLYGTIMRRHKLSR